MSADAEAAPSASGTRRHPAIVTTLVAVAVVVLDQLSKHWALSRLGDGSTIDLVWTLRLNLAFNTGMAFSRGQGLGPFIAVAGVIVLVVLLVSLRHDDSILGSVAAGLVIGGAAGNIIDRLFRGEGWLRGAVVDFIDLQWFPIFNLADAALTIGAVLILVSALLGNDRRAGTAA